MVSTRLVVSTGLFMKYTAPRLMHSLRMMLLLKLVMIMVLVSGEASPIRRSRPMPSRFGISSSVSRKSGLHSARRGSASFPSFASATISRSLSASSCVLSVSRN